MNHGERAKQAIIEKMKQGGAYAALPLGYQYTGREYRYRINGKRKILGRNVIINEEKAAIVRDIFNSYLNGIKGRELRHLILTKYGMNMGSSHLFGILNNTFYFGIQQYDGQIYPHKYDHIIDKETFDKVQAELQRANRKKSKKSVAKIQEIKVIKQSDPLLNYCKSGRSLDEIIDFTKLSLIEVQDQLVNLELEGKIEDVNGLWKTIFIVD